MMNASHAEALTESMIGSVIFDPKPNMGEMFHPFDGIKWSHPEIPGDIYKFRSHPEYFFKPDWLRWNKDKIYSSEYRMEGIVYACTGNCGYLINTQDLYMECLNTVDYTG